MKNDLGMKIDFFLSKWIKLKKLKHFICSFVKKNHGFEPALGQHNTECPTARPEGPFVRAHDELLNSHIENNNNIENKIC